MRYARALPNPRPSAPSRSSPLERCRQLSYVDETLHGIISSKSLMRFCFLPMDSSLLIRVVDVRTRLNVACPSVESLYGDGWPQMVSGKIAVMKLFARKHVAPFVKDER